MTEESEFQLLIKQAIAKAVLAERERCAKVCDAAQLLPSVNKIEAYFAGFLAAEIRKM